MKTVLVTYATMSGSTAEVAGAIGEELSGKGLQVKVLPLEKAADLTPYDAVVLGAPMIMGWHRQALRFLRTHRKELEGKPLAIFAMAMSLTSTPETAVKGVPVGVDPELAKPLRDPQHPTFRESYASASRYAVPILRAAGMNKPACIAFFGGKLEIYRLKLPAKLFVVLVVQAAPGDRRNWPFIRSWADELPARFETSHP